MEPGCFPRAHAHFVWVMSVPGTSRQCRCFPNTIIVVDRHFGLSGISWSGFYSHRGSWRPGDDNPRMNAVCVRPWRQEITIMPQSNETILFHPGRLDRVIERSSACLGVSPGIPSSSEPFRCYRHALSSSLSPIPKHLRLVDVPSAAPQSNFVFLESGLPVSVAMFRL